MASTLEQIAQGTSTSPQLEKIHKAAHKGKGNLRTKLFQFCEVGAPIIDFALFNGVPIAAVLMGTAKLAYNPGADSKQEFEKLVYIINQDVTEIAKELLKEKGRSDATDEELIAIKTEIWNIRKQIRDFELRNHQPEKIVLFQSIFVNSITNNTLDMEAVKIETFLIYVENFTTLHIRLLQQISECQAKGQPFTTDDLLNQPGFDTKEAFYFNVVGDLSHRMLVNTDFIAWRNGAPKLVRYNITSFGKEFIAFIQ